MKSSPAKTPRNSMFTNSKNAKETAHPVTNPAKVDVGAMEKTIVRNSPKSIAAHSVIKADVLAHSLATVAIYFARADALGPRHQIAWHAGIFTMTGFASKNVRLCSVTIQSNTSGKRIPMESMPMEPLVSGIVPSIS